MTLTEACEQITWALDIDGDLTSPTHGYPISAHQIVDDQGDVKITACGKRLTRWNHPRGWWSTPADQLPLAEHAIHCQTEGADVMSDPADDTTGIAEAVHREAADEAAGQG